MLMSIAIVGVIRSSSIESIDEEAPQQVQNPAIVEHPVVAGTTAIATAVGQVGIENAKSREECYSPNSQDESWLENQIARRALGDKGKESGDASPGGYSSVSDEDEQHSLSDFWGPHDANSDDGSQTGGSPGSALKYVCTNGESEEEDNPGGDEVYYDTDGNSHPYKWTLKNHAGDIVGIFERCQARCWGCEQGWKEIVWPLKRTPLDLLSSVSHDELCSVPGCKNTAYKFCRVPPHDGSTDLQLAHKHLHP
jgi:hypothetical protein